MCKTRLPFQHQTGLHLRCWSLALALLFVAHIGFAQDGQSQSEVPPAPTPVAVPDATPVVAVTTAKDSALTAEELKTRIAELEARDTPPAEAISAYKEALANMQMIAQSEQTRADSEAARLAAPAQLAALTAQVGAPATSSSSATDASTVQELQSILVALESQLAATRAELAQLEQEPLRRATRRAAIPQEIQQLRLAAATTTPTSTPAPDTPQVDIALSQAKAASALSASMLRDAQIRALKSELSQLDAQAPLLTAQRDDAARRVASQEAGVQALKQQLEKRRREDAEAATQDARRLARVALPMLAELATENAELAGERTGANGVLAKLAEVNADVTAMVESEREISMRSTALRQKVEIVGLVDAVGPILRKEASSLPKLAPHQSRLKARADLIPLVQLKVMNIQEERDTLADQMNHRVAEIVAKLPSSVIDLEKQAAEEEARSLLANRLNLLQQLLSDYEEYVAALVNADVAERRLIATTKSLSDYIAERLLWIRSVSPLNKDLLAESKREILWLSSLANWKSAFEAIRGQIVGAPVQFSVYGVIFLCLVAMRYRLKGLLLETSAQARKRGSHSFVPTIQAVLATILITCPLPFGLWVLFAHLAEIPDVTPFTESLSVGVIAALQFLIPLELFRHACRKDGLAEGQLSWPEESVNRLRRGFKIFNPLFFAVASFAFMLSTQPLKSGTYALGTWLALAGLALAGYFSWKALDPDYPILAGYLEHQPPRKTFQVKWISRPIAAIIPISLLVLAFLGWTYGALPLARRYLVTIIFVLTMIFVRAILHRSIAVRRRNLRLDQFFLRRSIPTNVDPKGGSAESEVEAARVAQDKVNTAVAGAQATAFVNTCVVLITAAGLLGIWSGVLPALHFLDSIQLWESGTIVQEASAEGANLLMGGTATTADPSVALNAKTVPKFVTLADLLAAILTFVVTFLAVRNLLGLIEIALPRIFGADAGLRFAIVTFARYLIVLVGMSVGLSLLGIGWEKVHFLAAAMTVGLGFGLQEIFANFISGLIILWERPMRLGDIVTVGDVSGHVTQIRMRATIITDWDNRELLVPNKEFVIGRLVNWTLTSPTTRFNIEVGVAYGSDTARAMTILKEIAAANEFVSEEPAPQAVFWNFADSSLVLRLYAYLPNRTRFFDAITSIRSEITRRFAEEKIIIAFPQLDVHFDRPLDVGAGEQRLKANAE